MAHFIVPLAICGVGLMCYLFFKSRTPDPAEIEDPTYDVWHKDFEDIWRKSA